MTFSLPILIVILSYTWIVDPFVDLPRWARHVPAVTVMSLAIWRATRTGEWGLRRRKLVPALGMATALTVPLLIVMYVSGVLLETTQARERPWADFAYLLLWGGGQQFALQTVLLREAQQATSRAAGIWIAALVFAALHLPNPFLTAVTFAGGVLWCRTYDRHPNILPLAPAHASATLVILYSFDERITGRLRVGYAYLLLGSG